MEIHDETALLVPPDVRHLRAIRLLAADAAGRAGLDSSEIDDLRIAVDELAHAIMGTAKERILVRFSVRGGQVLIRGSTPNQGGPEPRLHAAAELIVDAATDQYMLTARDGDVVFLVRKQTAGVRAS